MNKENKDPAASEDCVLDDIEFDPVEAVEDYSDELEEKENPEVEWVITENQEPIDSQRILSEIDELESQAIEKSFNAFIASQKPSPVDESIDVKKILAEIEELEERTLHKALNSRAMTLSSILKKTERLDSEDQSHIKRTLAEMSFIEGNESLAGGNRSRAIMHYREALEYDPNSELYNLKLGELLAEDPAAWDEAEQLFLKAIEIAPSNLEFRAKLAELRLLKNEGRPESPTPRRGTQNLTAKRVRAGKAAANFRLMAQEAWSELPSRIKTRDLAILFFIVVLTALFAFQRQKAAQVVITPIIPSSGMPFACSSLINFQWSSSSEDVRYLLQIETDGKKVFERLTDEKIYSFSNEEMKIFKADLKYRWRVVPLPLAGSQIDYLTRHSEFSLAEDVDNCGK